MQLHLSVLYVTEAFDGSESKNKRHSLNYKIALKLSMVALSH